MRPIRRAAKQEFELVTNSKTQPARPRRRGDRIAARMRVNIWIILAALLALLVITRYMQHERDTDRICANDPTASVCQR
jgi:hypothetical protein